MRWFVALCTSAITVLVASAMAWGDPTAKLLPPVTDSTATTTATPPALPAEPTPVDGGTPSAEQPTSQEKDMDPAGTSADETKGTDAETPTERRWIPEMLGDQAPIGTLISLPSGRVQGRGELYVPSARYFRISDNESPEPQDRTYFSFNYLYDLGDTINRLAGGGIEHTRIHTEVFGWEWADSTNTSSIGLRLPIETYNASGLVRGLDGASTDLGDLTIIFKQALWQDKETGSLLSGGLAVTPPTGPSPFAGSRDVAVFHNTCLQPFAGWIWAHERWYLQGFTAINAPTDLNDVVLLSNSIAAGYFLYQSGAKDRLMAVVPTVELHVTDPLNHRGILALNDPAGTPDMVDITGGVQFEYTDKTSAGLAFAVPVSGPRMFDFEILFQFRCRY